MLLDEAVVWPLVVVLVGSGARGRVLVLALGVAVVASLGAAFVAQGSSAGGAVVLGSSQFPAYPEIAADGSVGFDAVWERGGEILTAHWSSLTRAWSPAVSLPGSVPGQWEPEVAGSPTGAAAIVWSQEPPTTSPGEVMVSYRPAQSQVWSQPVDISSRDLTNPQVGMDSRGDAFAAWSGVDGLYVAERPANESAWLAPVLVRRAGIEAFAVNSAGAAVSVWENGLPGNRLFPGAIERDELYVIVKPAGQAKWLAPVNIGRSGYYGLQDDADPYMWHPQVAINAHGTIFIAYQWSRKKTWYTRVAVLSASDRWRKARSVLLSPAGTEPKIAASDRGDATVNWNDADESEVSQAGHVLATRAPMGCGSSALAANADGDLVCTGGQAAVRPTGGNWCPAIELVGGDGQSNAAAIAPNGLAQVIWEQAANPKHDVIRA